MPWATVESTCSLGSVRVQVWVEVLDRVQQKRELTGIPVSMFGDGGSGLAPNSVTVFWREEGDLWACVSDMVRSCDARTPTATAQTCLVSMSVFWTIATAQYGQYSSSWIIYSTRDRCPVQDATPFV
jgi:hypothetical protein